MRHAMRRCGLMCPTWLKDSTQRTIPRFRLLRLPACYFLVIFLFFNLRLWNAGSTWESTQRWLLAANADEDSYKPKCAAATQQKTTSRDQTPGGGSPTRESPNCQRLRQEQLLEISRKLPGFDPNIDVESWLWKPMHAMSDRPLSYGVKGIEEQINVLSSNWRLSDHRLSSLDPYPDVSWDPAESEPRCLKTCVVVGGSHELLKFRLGREIDRHDVVIRLNDAPAAPPFSEYVGSKTSLRVFFPESSLLVNDDCTWNNSCNKTEYMMIVYKPDDLHWLLLLANPCLSEADRQAALRRLNLWKPWCLWQVPHCVERLRAALGNIRILNPKIIYEASRIAGYSDQGLPSSGFSTITMALHRCATPISIAGFTFGLPADPNTPVHYYRDSSDRPGGWRLKDMRDPKLAIPHEFTVESAFIKRLVELGLVKDLMVDRSAGSP